MHTYTSPSFLIILLLCLGIGHQLPAQTPLSLAWENRTTLGSQLPNTLLESKLDGSIISFHHVTNPGNIYWVCRKMSASGEELWTYSFTDSLFPHSYLVDAALDWEGNLLIVATSNFLVSTETNNYYGSLVQLYKISPGGQLIWQQSYRSSDLQYSAAAGLLIDENNKIIVSGGTRSAEFGSTDEEVFVISYDANGVLGWETFLGRGGGVSVQLEANRLKVVRRANFGNYHIHEIDRTTGSFTDLLSLENVDPTTRFRWFENQTGYYFIDPFNYYLLKYDDSGTQAWEYALTRGEHIDRTISVVVDTAGCHYILGKKDGMLLLSKLNANGLLLWEVSLERYLGGSCIGWWCENLSVYGNSVFVADVDTSGSVLSVIEFDATNGTLLQELSHEEEVGYWSFGGTANYRFTNALYLTGRLQEAEEDYFVINKYELITTPVNTVDNSIELDLYPNPVLNELHIRTDWSEIEQIVLYGHLGRPLKHWQWKQPQNSTVIFDCTQLPSGMYLLMIKPRAQHAIYKKIVKQ